MKKFTKILALSLVLIMSVMVFASCAATPAKDPKDAKKALEDNDYEVMFVDDEDLLGKDMEATIVAMKGEDEMITIAYYKTAEAAKEAYEDAEKEFEDFKEEYKDAVLGKSGKMVWMATSKDAVKAAK